jgi:TRAP-type C4-dicarboxylate transport system permease small subunit
MFISMIINIVARKLGNSIILVEELSGYATVWATYLGIGFALREGRHVRVDLLTRTLSPRWQGFFRFWGDIVTVIFSGVITWKGIYLIQVSQQVMRQTPYSHIPIYLLQIVLPVGMILFALEAMVDAKSALQKFRRNETIRL